MKGFVMIVVRHARSGFSFIELVVVIMVMAILAGLGVPMVMNLVDKARVNSTRSNLQALKSAIVMFKNDTSRYPTKLRDLVEKPKEEAVARKWQKGGYMESGELPQDAWSEDFQYKRTPDGKHPYELYSYGSEGAGSDKSEWISVWDKQ